MWSYDKMYDNKVQTHTLFVESLNKLLIENLFMVQDTQKLNDPEKVSSTWVKHLYGLVDQLNDTETQMTGMNPKDAIELKKIPLLESYPSQSKRATDRICCKKTYR